MASVQGTGPVAITTAKGAHLTIPLSALTYSQGAITISGWTAPDSDTQTAAQNWASYLLGQSDLAPAPSPTTAPAGPAFLLEATHPGLLSSQISVAISGVTAANPPDASTIDMTVSVTNAYSGLTLATLGSTIGTSEGGGSQPGLVFLSSADPPSDLPVGSASAVEFSGDPPKAVIACGNGTQFTLTGVADIGTGTTFTVEVPAPVAGKFELDVVWSLAVTDKKPSELPALFQSVVKITAPSAGFGVPKELTYPLTNGADPDPTAIPPTPAVPAKATVPSA
jgi:hypothetical protein